MASSRFGKHWLDSAGIAYRRIGVAISGAYADRASAPTITAGTAAPTSTSQAEGSLYIRTSTVIGLYQYRSSAWVLVVGMGSDFGSTGMKTDVIAESTSAAGVTVDGVLLKDGVNQGTLFASNVSLSAEQTGTGSEQDIAHGLGATPALVFAVASNLTGGAYVITYGTHDATNAKVTATSGEKYRVVAFK